MHGYEANHFVPGRKPSSMRSIRLATPGDAADIQAIYAPYVTDSAVSFEEVAPSTADVRRRIASKVDEFPWLVCVEPVETEAEMEAKAEVEAGAEVEAELETRVEAENDHQVDEERSNGGAAGERVVGYAYASQHRSRLAYRWSVDVSVYVVEGVRRGGVATGLYTALFDVLRAQGFVNAYAGTALPNPASVGFHDAMGFESVGTYEEVGYKHGAWRDVQWWVKRLAARDADPAEPVPVGEIRGSEAWKSALAAGEARLKG